MDSNVTLIRCSAVACLLLLIGPNARGEPAAAPDLGRDLTPTARELSDRGLQHYQQGNYDAAIESFMEAFALLENPGLLFNIAQAYRLKQDCAHAQEYYARYVAAAPESALRGGVERRLAEMRLCNERSGARAGLPATAGTPMVSTAVAATVAVPMATNTLPTQAGATTPRHAALVWGLRGSAAALLFSTGVFAGLAWDARQDVQNASVLRNASEANDRYVVDTQWAWTLGIAGVTCALASYLIGRTW